MTTTVKPAKKVSLKSFGLRSKQDLVGRFVRVRWDDIGCTDELVLNITERGSIDLFSLQWDACRQAEFDQIVIVGPRLTAPKF